MKRTVIVASLVALIALAVSAPATVGAPGGNSAATINVVFAADFLSAEITSTKGVSNYEVTLCDGTTFKVELSGDDETVTAGPYDVQIVSVAVKSGTTRTTFASGFAGDCEKKEPPEDPKK